MLGVAVAPGVVDDERLGHLVRRGRSALVTINEDDELSRAAVWAIQEGMCDELKLLLDDEPWLALAWLRDADPLSRVSWSLLHVVTGWPGHFPDGPTSVELLVQAGANVNARFRGDHEETPLHWAASSDDVGVLDALLDAGADIEAPGAVIGGGTPLADARGYKQWRAAFRLVERGARTTLVDAATLGLLDRVSGAFANGEPPGPDDVDAAFWGACHGGRTETAEFLLGHGAQLNRVPPWAQLTPLDAAERERAEDLVTLLRSRGARTADELST